MSLVSTDTCGSVDAMKWRLDGDDAAHPLGASFLLELVRAPEPLLENTDGGVLSIAVELVLLIAVRRAVARDRRRSR